MCDNIHGTICYTLSLYYFHDEVITIFSMSKSIHFKCIKNIIIMTCVIYNNGSQYWLKKLKTYIQVTTIAIY
jgi:hypothetical protein